MGLLGYDGYMGKITNSRHPLSLETKIYIFMVNEKHPKRRFLNREALDLGRKTHGFPVPV